MKASLGEHGAQPAAEAGEYWLRAGGSAGGHGYRGDFDRLGRSVEFRHSDARNQAQSDFCAAVPEPAEPSRKLNRLGNDPGGVTAISRWLSEATPPETGDMPRRFDPRGVVAGASCDPSGRPRRSARDPVFPKSARVICAYPAGRCERICERADVPGAERIRYGATCCDSRQVHSLTPADWPTFSFDNRCPIGFNYRVRMYTSAATSAASSAADGKRPDDLRILLNRSPQRSAKGWQKISISFALLRALLFQPLLVPPAPPITMFAPETILLCPASSCSVSVLLCVSAVNKCFRSLCKPPG